MYHGPGQVRTTALQTACTTVRRAQSAAPSKPPASISAQWTRNSVWLLPIPARPADNKILTSSVGLMDSDVRSDTQYRVWVA
ncbi:hypothetical protein VTN96DRAFT_10452 [Rasamsonia emersonii]